MRKIFLLSALAFFATNIHAQVTGIKTVPGDYATIAAAVTALNTSGVGAGGATINVAAGYTETVPSNGLLLGSATLNASLSATNPLIFAKSGAGADPVLTAFTGGSSLTSDGIFKLAGTDYVTIDGIDLQENAANSGNALMEWGYAFVSRNAVAPFDGCNNNTVKNCTIQLNRLNANGSAAIYFGHNIATNATALTITAAGDQSNNNKIYSNNISNCLNAVYFLGFAAATPYTLYDQGNDIGGSSAATGNTISNMGGNTLFYTFCIDAAYQNNMNVSYNTINNTANGGVNNVTAVIGMYLFGTNSTFTANNNNITLTNAAAAAYTTYTCGIYSNAAGTNLTANNNTINETEAAGAVLNLYGIYYPSTGNFTANSNSITQSQSVSGPTYGIYSSAAGTVVMNSNTIKTITPVSVTGIYGALNQTATATGGVTMNNNIFDNCSVNTTGTTYLLYSSNGTSNTTFTNNSILGGFTRAGTSGTMYGFYNNGGPGVGTATLSGNNFSNISLAGTTAFDGFFSNGAVAQIVIFTNNTISNISGSTGAYIGLYHSYGAVGSLVNGNTVSNLSTGGALTGIQIGNTASLGLSAFSNNINGLSSTGASAVNGLLITNGTNTSVYKNKIYNLSVNNAGGTVNGLSVAAGTTTNIYNNLIGDLRAPISTAATDAIRGINLTATTAASTIAVNYNTVYLAAASTGTNFSTSALFATTSATATSAALTFKNNILYNNSTPNGTGIASAFRRSSATLTNYASSANNLLFAGAPGASNVLYYDGTTGSQTIAAFQAAVTPRDAGSVTELSTPFLSTTGGGPTFLHINPAIGTVAESGGTNIATITDDYDGDTRNATTPDIGADEFAGTTPTACSGTPTAGTISGSANICQGTNTVLTLTGYTTGATGISIQWKSSATAGGPYTNIAGATGATYNTGVITPGTTVYYVVTVTCANGGGNATTAEFSVTSNPTPVIGITPPAPSICTAGTGVPLTASGASTYTWSPVTGLSATTGATVTANPAVTTTYTVIGTSAFGCTASGTVTVTVNTSPSITAAAGASSTLVCSGDAVNLTSSAISNIPGNLINESFEGGAIPTGWVSINGGTGNLWAVPAALNGTARTGTKAAEYNWNTTQAANAYLITNGLSLTGGVTYTISSWYKNSGTTFPEKLKVTVGTAQTVAAQTTIIQDIGTITSTTYAQQSATFTPATSGTYYFAWNAYSAANEFYLDVDDILITGPAPTPTYSWTSVPAGFTSALQNPTGVVTTVNTVYTVTASNPSGCSVSSSVTVNVNNPTPYLVTGGGNYCAGGTGQLVGVANSETGVTYQLVLNGTTNIGSPIPGTTGSAISFGLQTTAGTYTVVATRGSCTTTMIGSVVININPVPVITPTITQPSTCATSDGSINIVISASTGPYTFAWTGPGVNATAQNQTGLSIGNYSVTVTSTVTLCSTTASYILTGPGGCFICPAIGSLVSNPSSPVCSNTSVALNVSGLNNMGITYGILYKYSTTALADPYVGGTTIATVANGSLGGGGTTATTSTTFAANTYFVYAILSPTPVDPACRPSKSINLVVNQAPNATISYAGTPYCQSSGTANVTLTGTTGGVFSSDAGLTLNAATGAVTLGTSTAGGHTVTYTIAASGGCSTFTTTAPITVTATPAATISYAGTPFCTSGPATGTVTQTGTAGGTYSSTAGLIINAATGAITVGTSTPGNYVVTYTVAASGGCAVFTTTTNVLIANCTVSVTATVGTLGPVNYPNLKFAFDAINAGTHRGVVAVSVNANTTETAQASLNRSGTGASNYTSVTVRPTADNLTLSGNIANTAIIKLNAAANVTIDGDNAGTTGTNRNLTITNISATGPSIIWIGGSLATPASTDTLRNCILINGASTASGVVVSDNTTLGTAGYFSSVAIQNNSIQKCYIANYNIAVPAAGNGTGLNVSNNDFNATGVNSNRLVGVYVQGVDGATVANNNISNIANTLDAANITGIWAATATVNTTISGNQITTLSGTASAPRGIVVTSGVANANMNVSGNTVAGLTSSSTGTTTGIWVFTATSGVTIQKNKISNIKNTQATGFGCNGIQLSTTLTTANTVNVYDNFVSDIAAVGFNGTGVGDNGYGIIVTSGGGYNLYYNTVVMNTNQTVATGLPAALNVVAGVTTLNVRDNIFVNTQTVGTQRYCVFSGATAAQYTDINYNDYYFTGPNLGNIGGVLRANLAAWQTGTTKDANSMSVQPNFVSATDLHLATSGNCLLDATGTPITTPAVTTDIDGDTRNATTPDIGADEFTSAPRTATISYAGSPYCPSGTAAVTQTGITGGTYSSTTGLTIDPVTGTINLGTSTPGTYTVTYSVPVSGGCAAFAVTGSVTINTVSTAPTGATASNANICGTNGTTNLSVVGGTLGTGASYKWYIGSCGGGTAIGTGATLTNIAVFSTTTFYVRAEGPCGNTTCASVTVNVNPAPSVVLTAASNAAINPFSHSVLQATVSPAGNYTYQYTRDGVILTNATGPVILLTPDSVGSYVVKVTNTVTGCTATSNTVVITAASSDNIFISPNPNNGHFQVRYYSPASGFGSARAINVYDSKGSRVASKKITVTSAYTITNMDISQYSRGAYTVAVTDANGKLLASGQILVLP